MRTVDQWLALPDNKLALELGRAFTPESDWKHDWVRGITFMSPITCTKCGCDERDVSPQSCTVPDPIKINWNTAMEKFRQYSPSRTILRQVCGPEPIDCISWFLVSAQPKHYLITAAMAVERNKE